MDARTANLKLPGGFRAELVAERPLTYRVAPSYDAGPRTSSNCYVVASDGAAVVVDACLPELEEVRERGRTRLKARGGASLRLALDGLLGADARLALAFTHLHFDHIGFAEELLDRVWRVYVGKAECEALLARDYDAYEESLRARGLGGADAERYASFLEASDAPARRLCGRLLGRPDGSGGAAEGGDGNADADTDTDTGDTGNTGGNGSADAGGGAAGAPPVVAVSPGDRVTAGLVALDVVDASGHTPGCLAFFEPAAGTLLCGDAVLYGVTPSMGSDAAFSDGARLTRATLDRLGSLPFARVCPGHGAVMGRRQALGRIDRMREHHRLRLSQVVGIVSEDPGVCCADVAERIPWSHPASGKDAFRRGSMLGNVSAMLDCLVSEGVLVRRLDADGVARYRASDG